MRPPPVLHRLLVLSLLALLAGAWAPVLSTAAVPAAVRERTIVVVKDGRVTRLVDPATGTTLWEVNTWATAALGPDGTLYLGVPRDGGTDILAASPAAPKPTRIARGARDDVLLGGVPPAGDRLWLLTDYTDGLPGGIESLPLPAGTDTKEPAPRAYRDDGPGMLRSDGSRWYGVHHSGEGRFELMEVRFEDGAAREATPLPGRIGDVRLLSPSGRHLYVIRYLSQPQTITVIDTVERAIARTVDLGYARIKAPPCAAVLSPGGQRLYMVASDGSMPLGIDVLDTATFERVARFFPGRAFYCLAISADGERLYADTWEGELLTIDAATGEELNSVPVATDPAPPYLGLATSTG